MLPNIGAGEIMVLLAVGLIFFGANRIPEAARSLGRSLNAFKEGLRETSQPDDAKDAPRRISDRTV